MVVVVCANVPLATTEKRDTFLSLLQKVSEETQDNELDCLSYFWLRPDFQEVETADTDVFVRGLEVYTNDDALSVVHRSGKKYKEMRETVAARSLISSYPKGGIPMYTSAGVGYLSKKKEFESISEGTFFTISDFEFTKAELKEHLLEQLENLAEDLKGNSDVLSLTAFRPQEPSPQTSVILYSRSSSEQGRDSIEQKLQSIESIFQDRGGSVATSRWRGAGFGFIRRNI